MMTAPKVLSIKNQTITRNIQTWGNHGIDSFKSPLHHRSWWIELVTNLQPINRFISFALKKSYDRIKNSVSTFLFMCLSSTSTAFYCVLTLLERQIVWIYSRHTASLAWLVMRKFWFNQSHTLLPGVGDHNLPPPGIRSLVPFSESLTHSSSSQFVTPLFIFLAVSPRSGFHPLSFRQIIVMKLTTNNI